MTIATVIGARPQFVKAAAVSRILRTKIDEIMIHTGQHYDENMSDVFFEELELPKPKYNLGVGGKSHGIMTAQILTKCEEIFLKEKPKTVLIYGDTNSTLAAALAAVKLHIPIAHVEAGMRSFNRKMPEEINRILSDQCSSMLFTPTSSATQNLINEGFSPSQIHEVGDVMYDAALYYRKESRAPSKPYFLVTIHRAENTDNQEKMKEIVAALIELSKKQTIIWPIHPRTKKMVIQYGLWNSICDSIQILEPVGYLEMLKLEGNAQLIITDSGGVQKEAFFCKVPCVTIRDETEWIELVEHGFNQLSLAKKEEILTNVSSSLKSAPDWKTELYGNGQSVNKIVSHLLR